MEQLPIGSSGLSGSRLVYGCMRLAGDGSGDDAARGRRAVRAAVDAGFTVFDHADIYGDGRSESLFGEVLRESPALRDGLVIVGKCGIVFESGAVPKHYDLSSAHIVRSVEGSLDRLGVEHLDVLLLHRPDYLLDPDDVASAFERLSAAGKVAHFGVSNFSPAQVRLLAAAVDRPLAAHQFELNLENIAALDDGTLDQCRELGMTPQAWSPLAGPVYRGWTRPLSDAALRRLRAELDAQASTYGVEDWHVILAWLLRHPAGIAPIIGSTSPQRIRDAARALDIDYARTDWYRLLEARQGVAVA
jgi:predicted oxidoreductase